MCNRGLVCRTDQAESFRAPIWDGSDYPVWESFIREMQQRLAGPDREAE